MLHKIMKEKYEDIQNFLDGIPDKFDILEEGVDFQTQKEYLDYSHSFDLGELTETETINLGHILCDTRTEIDGKKKAMTLLAHLGTITAYRQIEKYYQRPDNDLRKWAVMALQECRMLLESMLLDENKGFIISGLGGLKDKMRFYFLMLPVSDKPFTIAQKNIIKEEVNLVANDLNCIVETQDPADKFVGLTVLVPMDVAVGTFIETGIKKCNNLGGFVFEHYYVTNTDIPDLKEIEDIIKIVRE
ncbi:hypothetical protein [Aquiflexum sp.]|uniref:hypothetical protein n=1 Tax=Aquiflexum sp. TaxID=1872584 RepID=UPI003593DDD3